MDETPAPEPSQDNEDHEKWLREQLDDLRARLPVSRERWQGAVYTILGEYLPAIAALKMSRDHFADGLCRLLEEVVGLSEWEHQEEPAGEE